MIYFNFPIFLLYLFLLLFLQNPKFTSYEIISEITSKFFNFFHCNCWKFLIIFW